MQQKLSSREEDWIALRSMADHLRSKAMEEKKAWRRQIKALSDVIDFCDTRMNSAKFDDQSEIDYALYEQAFDLVCAHQNASASWLQRKLGISYPLAARIIRAMEAENIVGPPNHVGYREVLRDELGRQL